MSVLFRVYAFAGHLYCDSWAWELHVPQPACGQIYDLPGAKCGKEHGLRNAGMQNPCPRSAWEKAYRDFGVDVRQYRQPESEAGAWLCGESWDKSKWVYWERRPCTDQSPCTQKRPACSQFLLKDSFNR